MHAKIMDLLPNISQLVVQPKELRQAQEALESAGLDALVRPLPFYLLQGLGGVDARVRSAWLVNRLLQFSRTDDFASEIESTFFHSMVLRDRWPVVEEAILMHREGRYLLSIPAAPRADGRRGGGRTSTERNRSTAQGKAVRQGRSRKSSTEQEGRLRDDLRC